MSVLKADFVERHISSMPHVPTDWCIGPGFFYQLNLKMCQIRTLEYGFRWGKGGSIMKVQSVIEEPQKILELDVSLNDLTTLEHIHLAPFQQLRLLNASLNRIERYIGVETLKHLIHLDLSHNNISKLMGLQGCPSLLYLNLGMNKIDNISLMPSLTQLKELHLNNNKLKSLDGVQGLPQLQELHVQRNFITDIIPLSSNLRMRILNAADNHIGSFSVTLDVLQGLKRLQAVTLHGNPIEREHRYQSKLIEMTSITLLDNINVRPHPREREDDPYNHNLTGIKEATKQAFLENLADRRQTMEENVRFMQKRILALQDEFKQYEVKTHTDLEACLRYLDTLSLEDAERYSYDFLRDRIPMKKPPPIVSKPWISPRHPVDEDNNLIKSRYNKSDYRDVRKTDEVLRFAYNELARDQHHME